MKDYSELINKKYNKLLILEVYSNYQKKKKTCCKCLCDCGNIKIIPLYALKNESTKSCGCLKKEILIKNNKNRAKNPLKNHNKKETKVKEVKQLINLIGNKYGKLTVIEMLYSFKNGNTYCKCECDCGNQVTVIAADLKRGTSKSCGCSRYSLELNTQKTNNLLGFQIGKIKVISMSNKRAKNGAVIWNYECQCGNFGCASGSDIKRGQIQSCGCNKLIKSQYEDTVKKILTDNNINYIQQYRFKDCKYQKLLPFDFYLPDYNLCIECQGQQHFYPVEYFGGVKNFEIVKIRDKIKSDYCSLNNIILICLPYTYSKDEMRNTILNTLSPVTITV